LIVENLVDSYQLETVSLAWVRMKRKALSFSDYVKLTRGGGKKGWFKKPVAQLESGGHQR